MLNVTFYLLCSKHKSVNEANLFLKWIFDFVLLSVVDAHRRSNIFRPRNNTTLKYNAIPCTAVKALCINKQHKWASVSARVQVGGKTPSRFPKKTMKMKKKWLKKTNKKGGGQKSLLGRRESEDKKWNVKMTDSV